MNVCIDVLGHVHTAGGFPVTPAVLGESQLTLSPAVQREDVKQVEGKAREAESRVTGPEEMGVGEADSSEEEGADCTPRSVFRNGLDLAAFTSIIHLLSS